MSARERIVGKVLASKKYAGIDRAAVERICDEALARYKKEADAEKAVRRTLHIACASFGGGESDSAAEAMLAGYSGGAPLYDKDFCRGVMALHASTRERLSHLEAFYAAAFGAAGPCGSVADIGCGLHPFALAWMPLGRDVRYRAFDINAREVALLNEAFARSGCPNAQAAAHDAMEGPPAGRYDAAFVMKLLPVLETRRRGAGAALLQGLDARRVIATFPTRSLGGGGRGMEKTYSAMMEGMVPARMEVALRAVVGDELLYVLAER